MRNLLRAIRLFWNALPRAARSVRSGPSFFLVASLSLAVALGLSTTVFAYIDALTHPTVPVRDVESLYRVAIVGNGSVNQPSGDEVARLIGAIPSFDGVAIGSDTHGTVSAGEKGGNADAYAVRPDYFATLGVSLRLGRFFTSGETDESGVAILSDALWRLLFNNRHDLGNAVISYDGREYTVVGVLPKGFDKVQAFDLWLPSPRHYSRYSTYIGRARRGTSPAQIRADLEAVVARLTTAYGVGRPPFSASLTSARPDPFQLTAYHGAMIGAAACILIIACGNISALMLARGLTKRRDHAVRLSLGATRGDLFAHVAAEVTVIAVAGGAVAVLITTWLIALLTGFVPDDPSALGIVFDAHWSGRVFAQAFAAMLAAIGLAAILPAWNASRIEPSEPLKESAGTTTGRVAKRFQVLVVAELALSMILLLGSSLIAKATRNIADFDFGYDAKPLFIASANIVVKPDSAIHRADPLKPIVGRPQVTSTQFDAALQRVRELRGVVGASPISGGIPEKSTVSSDESRGRTNALNLRIYLNVGPGFMGTLGVPIVEGRDFVEGDRLGRGGAILDVDAARQLFPGDDPLGRLVKLGDEASNRPWIPVVGIARTAVLRLPTDAFSVAEPQVYVSIPLEPTGSTDILVRPRDMRLGTMLATQRLLSDQFPPRSFVRTARWLRNYETVLAGRNFTASIFVGLAIASLALAAIGLFSVLSYSTEQRMREFAVRAALGANQRDVLSLVFRDGLVMALGGTVIGATLGVWAAGFLEHLLWDVAPWDASALVLAEVILLVVTMASCFVPALRATRSDPLTILRAT